jgi:hypothetical protein
MPPNQNFYTFQILYKEITIAEMQQNIYFILYFNFFLIVSTRVGAELHCGLLLAGIKASGPNSTVPSKRDCPQFQNQSLFLLA